MCFKILNVGKLSIDVFQIFENLSKCKYLISTYVPIFTVSGDIYQFEVDAQ
jgi:hypothetical protein